jgi:hypothetical protein
MGHAITGLIAVAGVSGALLQGTEAPEVYRGLCDASAAVALDARHFVVADDEHNVLQVYQRGKEDAVGSLSLVDFLGADKESDLEGAAQVGGVTYWISSHGLNAKGKGSKDRRRFFATEVVPGSQPPRLRTVGQPRRDLLEAMAQAASLKRYALDQAAQLPAEAPGGLNIEGLAATPQGALLIAFRNPIPANGALVLPLNNPREWLNGAAAAFGQPIELPLGGRGIRSMEGVGAGYLIVAGPPDDDGDFVVYRWSGTVGEAPAPVPIDLGTLRPEALFLVPGTHKMQLLSDDGGVDVDGKECKKLPAAQRRFRSLTIELAP